jgi:uncharacterized protein (TIGR03000 family)
MYSLVMMTALASSPQSAGFNGYFRDLFHGSGCSGVSAANANATSCSGCTGCAGCSGGGLFSGDRVRSFFSFGSGNCCGSVSNSCTGSVAMSCNGCGGCMGSYAWSCSGGGAMIDMGTPYALPANATYYAGCFGAPMTAMPFNAAPISPTPSTIPPTSLPMAPGTPYAQPAPAEIREYTPQNQLPLPGGAASSPTRATIIVKLPVDARLSAEGRTLKLTGTERTFVSPDLPTGQEFNYTFRIEYDRDGRTLSESQSIKVQAGKVSTLEFGDRVLKSDAAPVPVPSPKPEAAPALKTAANPTSIVKADSAGERAHILVKVPTGAKFAVNGVAQSAQAFKTPVLPRGQEFQYTMSVETVRGGHPETITQIVKVKAGDTTTVDFSDAGDTRTVSR